MSLAKQHIVVFGATGGTGVQFLKQVLALPSTNRPKLTLYGRSITRLQEQYGADPSIRLVQGSLSDSVKLNEAVSGTTAVVSFLGAYANLANFLTRATTPTTIADAMPILCKAMQDQKVKRILVLSTLNGFPLPGEKKNLGWLLWLFTVILPRTFVPLGDAEMRGIAQNVARFDDLDWTIFRVPHLNENAADLEVLAGTVDKKYQERGSGELSRASLARWVLGEIEEGNFIRQAPFLSNPT